MTRSQKARLNEREWETSRGFTSRINNNLRQEAYESYEIFCRSIGTEPALEAFYDLSISRIAK